MSELEIADAALADASAVADAYAVQVTRARSAWRSAPTPEIAARQKRRLTAATIQHTETLAARQDAFTTWHALHTEGRTRARG